MSLAAESADISNGWELDGCFHPAEAYAFPISPPNQRPETQSARALLIVFLGCTRQASQLPFGPVYSATARPQLVHQIIKYKGYKALADMYLAALDGCPACACFAAGSRSARMPEMFLLAYFLFMSQFTFTLHVLISILIWCEKLAGPPPP